MPQNRPFTLDDLYLVLDEFPIFKEIWPVLLFIVLTLFFIASLKDKASLAIKEQVKNGGKKTQATITEIKTVRRRKSFSLERYDEIMKIVFEVEGHKVWLRKIIIRPNPDFFKDLGLADKKIGDKIDVIINPDKPFECVFKGYLLCHNQNLLARLNVIPYLSE